MYCPKCGKDNPDEAVFCGSCGMAFPKMPKLETKVTFCPKCGSKVEKGAAFCGACGASLNTMAVSTSPKLMQTTVAAVGQGKKSFNKKLVPVIVAVAIVVIAIFVVSNITGSGGHGSAEEVSQTLETPLNKVYSSGMDEDSVRELVEAFVDGFPSKVMDAELKKSGMTRDDFTEECLSEFKSALGSMSSIASYLDKMQIKAAVKIRDSLDSDDIENINDKLDEYDIQERVTNGYKIGADVTVTALDDLPALSKGETKTNSISNLGIYAIQLGGKWYLWMPQFSW